MLAVTSVEEWTVLLDGRGRRLRGLDNELGRGRVLDHELGAAAFSITRATPWPEPTHTPSAP